jgi:D-aminoacyl-tRNA deacylase
MRSVIQRVSKAKVEIDNRTIAEIGRGLLVYLAIGIEDTADDAKTLADKVANLRIFDDERARMNYSLIDVQGEVLVVSEFTLYGDCRKGRRPNYIRASRPERARQLYESFIDSLRKLGVKVAAGEFQAMMKVELLNDGPVTLLLDTQRTI